ncbi:hypothetical protein HY571_01620 [Candidatus Micrarchaeota archaeon]|nr:hypothetical protein [Candidatus Micrarchaeota archaeon]
MTTLLEEINAAKIYLSGFPRIYANLVKTDFEAGSSFFPAVAYHQLLASIVHTLDPEPTAGRSYEQRLRRIFAGKKILELGARHGVFVHFLAEHGAEAEGIDSNDFAAAAARRHGVPVHTGLVEDLSGKKFDLIVSFQFFDPAYWGRGKPRIMDKIAGALKNRGHSIHVVLNSESAIDQRELRNTGLHVLTHRQVEGVMPTHVSIARKGGVK